VGVFKDVDEESHREMFVRLRSEARTGLEYIAVYRASAP